MMNTCGDLQQEKPFLFGSGYKCGLIDKFSIIFGPELSLDTFKAMTRVIWNIKKVIYD